MKTPATLPFAAFLGLPPRIRKKTESAARRKQIKAAARSKTRRREPRPIAAPIRKRFVARAEPREPDRKSRRPTFAELLGVDLPTPPKAQRQPAPAVADVSVPQPEPPPRRDGLSPTARRIIALAAEARGENLQADGIEAHLKRERDEACGITEVARAIIDRKAAKVAAGGVRSGQETA